MFFLNKKLPLMKTTLQPKPKSFSYQRPTQSSIQMSRYSNENCIRPFKSALDILNNRNKSKSHQSLRKNFYNSKILPLKSAYLSNSVSTKSQIVLNDNSEYNNNNLTLTDDENYDDDYIVINPLNSKYGDEITKLQNNNTKRLTKSNQSATSRNGSAHSAKKFDHLNLSNNSITISNLKSNSKKFYDSKKKIKKRISTKPTSLTNMNEANLIETHPIETHRHIRFTALLSIDAQFSFLKAYEDMIYVELTYIYPYIQTIPRTSTAKFIKFIDLNLQINDDNSEQNNRFKITLLIEQAMKILDSIQKFKAKLKLDENKENNDDKLKNRFSSYSTGVANINPVVILEEEEDEPLEM
jgi:hypothetical protein